MKVTVICAENIGRKFIEALARNRYSLDSVLSPDPLIHAGSVPPGTEVFRDRAAYYRHLEAQETDILFSIINPYMLEPWVLRRPRFGCFNYHDSLLPKHRGVNAVAWALWEGDSEIGFTWHKMTEKLDAGPIAYQTRIPLNGTETAFQANMKVFVRALQEFDSFLAGLKNSSRGTLELKEQPEISERPKRARDLPSESERTINLKNETASAIWRKGRCLNFGPGRNPFGPLLIDCPSEGLVPVDVIQVHPSAIPSRWCVPTFDGLWVELRKQGCAAQGVGA